MITMRAIFAGAVMALAAVLVLTPATTMAQPTKDTKDSKKKAPAAKGKADDDQPKEVKETPKKKPKAAQAAQPTLLGQFGDWGAYTSNTGGRKVCYALAKPASTQTEPANKPRDPTFVFIATRPADKVVNELSITAGYPYKTGSEATVDLGTVKFAMYTEADGAWIKNAADQPRLIETMRKSSEMVVTGESGKGTKSTDKYSLRGLSQALDRAAQECK